MSTSKQVNRSAANERRNERRRQQRAAAKEAGKAGKATATKPTAAVVKTEAAPAVKPRLQFFVGEKLIRPQKDELAAVCYFGTHGINGDQPRIGLKALEALLADLGVIDPRNTPWEVKLPNGVVCGARKVA